MADRIVVGSPEWWRDRLLLELDGQRKRVDLLERYAGGDHPLPEPPRAMNADVWAETKRAFQSLCKMGLSNWVKLVASAPAERLHVRAFRFGDDESASAEAWSLWTANGLDADEQLLNDTVFETGQAYAIVWPGPEEGEATITFEHPSQVIVAYADGGRAPVAALKRWKADDGRIMVTLYMADFLYKWRSRSTRPEFGLANGDLTWQERVVPLEEGGDEVEPWPLPNPLEEVNVVEYAVNKGLKARPYGGGRSEFASVLPIQDRINKTIFDRLVTAESQAFRQRYTIGWDPPVLPGTNRPDPRAVLEASQSRLWTFPAGEGPESVKVGELGQADFAPFVKAVEADINAMAAITKTPPHYLLGAMVNIAAEAFAAAESGLVMKTAAHSKVLGAAHAQTIRLALKAAGKAFVKPVTVWEDIERRSWAEKIDGLVKLKALDVPIEALWALIPGVTPQDVETWRTLRRPSAEPDATDDAPAFADS